jgi:hypothetical protein
MRTDCIVKLSKLKIFELNTLVQKETSDHVEGKPPPSDTMSSLRLGVWGREGIGARQFCRFRLGVRGTARVV